MSAQQHQGDKAPTVQSLLGLAQNLVQKLQVQDEISLLDDEESIQKLRARDEKRILNDEESILTQRYLDGIDLRLIPKYEEIKAVDDIVVKLWNSAIGGRSASMSAQLRCLYLQRTFKYSLKALDSMLNNNRIAWARTLMKRCIEYYEIVCESPVLSNISGVNPQVELQHEYMLQQLHLAWKEDQQDHADKWMENINQRIKLLTPAIYHRLVVLLVNIGQASSQKERFAEAQKWLLLANTLITSETIPSSLNNESELYLHLLQALIRFPATKLDPNCRELLVELFCKMNQSSRNSRPYQLMQLEFYTNPKIFEYPEFKSVDIARRDIKSALTSFARHATLNQAVVDTIIHYAYRQFSNAQYHAQDQVLTIVNELLVTRLKNEDNKEWIEKMIILIIVFQCTMDQPMCLGKKSIKKLLDDYHSIMGGPISTLGAQTCFMGITKCIRKSEENADISTFLQWYEIGEHEIFNQLDQENRARLQRRLMQTRISKGNLPGIQEACRKMYPSIQKSPELLYLRFQGDIRHGTVQSAQQTFKKLIDFPNIDKQFIYACIVEAQKNKRPIESILWVMRAILLAKGKSFSTPAMYRFALKHIKANENGSIKPVLSEQDQIKFTCELFDKAAQDMMQDTSEAEKLWDAHELQWFSTTCWNLALEHMDDWAAFDTFLLAQATVKFTGRLSDQSPSSSDINKRHLLAIFLDCAFSLICGKASQEHETRNERLRAVLVKSNDFCCQYDKIKESFDGETATEIHKKASGILSFAFEAALMIGDWNQAKEVLKYTKQDNGKYLDFKSQAVLGDLVLSTNAPLEETFNFLESIMNNCWSLTGDVQKLSCWIRCIFLMTIEADLEKADCILENVCCLAQTHSNYPDEELMWLAGHTYNRATEYYGSNQYDLWTKYTELALRLSKCMDDQSFYTNLATTINETNSSMN